MAVQTAVLLSVVGLLGLTAVGSLGQHVGRVIDDRAHGTAAPSALPAIGSRHAASVLSVLRRAVDYLPDAVVRGGYGQNATGIVQSLEAGFAHDEILPVARHLAMTRLQKIDAAVEIAQSPAPSQYASTMREFARYDEHLAPSRRLRELYDRALLETVPAQLDTLEAAFDEAYVAVRQELQSMRTAAGQFAPRELSSRLNQRWKRVESAEFLRAQREPFAANLVAARHQLAALSAKDALSPDDIFDLAQAVERVKYGDAVEALRRDFVPVFSETYQAVTSAEMVDALIEAQQLYQTGRTLRMPGIIEPFARRQGAPTYGDRTVKGTLAHNAKSLFAWAERWRWLPEGARRRAVVKEVFPGSDLYRRSPEDARAMIAAVYEVAVDGWQRNKFGEWRSRIRDAGSRLSESQKVELQRITSLPRIWTGTNARSSATGL